MIHKLENDFYLLCNEIISANKSIEEWVGIESDDMFQRGSYEGGFDATEMEFCFRVFINDIEYWFQLSLESINKIYSERMNEVEVRLADR